MKLTTVPVLDGFLAGRTLQMYGAAPGRVMEVLLPEAEAVQVDDEVRQQAETYVCVEVDGALALQLAS